MFIKLVDLIELTEWLQYECEQQLSDGWKKQLLLGTAPRVITPFDEIVFFIKRRILLKFIKHLL